jgi:hypothetical protein
MHGHLNVTISRCTVTWTSLYHDTRSLECHYITMHGHLNVTISRCTVTWTSLYHDARSPERQIRNNKQVAQQMATSSLLSLPPNSHADHQLSTSSLLQLSTSQVQREPTPNGTLFQPVCSLQHEKQVATDLSQFRLTTDLRILKLASEKQRFALKAGIRADLSWEKSSFVWSQVANFMVDVDYRVQIQR